MGGSLEQSADTLEDAVNIVRKHYLKWSHGRQGRISDLLARIWHTKKPMLEAQENQYFNLVAGVGVEPTLTLR